VAVSATRAKSWDAKAADFESTTRTAMAATMTAAAAAALSMLLLL
jgi:hypothetical protein